MNDRNRLCLAAFGRGVALALFLNLLVVLQGLMLFFVGKLIGLPSCKSLKESYVCGSLPYLTFGCFLLLLSFVGYAEETSGCRGLEAHAQMRGRWHAMGFVLLGLANLVLGLSLWANR